MAELDCQTLVQALPRGATVELAADLAGDVTGLVLVQSGRQVVYGFEVFQIRVARLSSGPGRP